MNRTHILLATLLGVVAAPGDAAGQIRVQLTGRVIEGADGGVVPGAIVLLEGRTAAATDDLGRFIIRDLAPGSHVIGVRAIGYADADTTITVSVDTEVVIALQPAPVRLDSLVAQARRVTIRGEVFDSETETGLIDAQVRLERIGVMQTDQSGWFTAEGVAAEVPLRIGVRALGYLPQVITLTPSSDTTVTFALETDSVAQQMIERQVERLENRAKLHDTGAMPSMDREYLMQNRNTTLGQLLRRRHGRFMSRVQCVVVDDVQHVFPETVLASMLPDRVERVEFLMSGSMLRVYTRDYIRRMMSSSLVLPNPVMGPGRPPFCR
jgi:hypothetical protein